VYRTSSQELNGAKKFKKENIVNKDYQKPGFTLFTLKRLWGIIFDHLQKI
jgi:hypothetical protein